MLRRASRTRRAEPTGENPYWISFSDLMSALLFVFVLALTAVVVRLQDQQQDLVHNTLQNAAHTTRLECELILEGEHYDYLARLT